MNKLVVIGGTGNQRVFLNVDRGEALKRYQERFPFDDFAADHITEFEFEDVFEAYAVWPVGGFTFDEAKEKGHEAKAIPATVPQADD